jgi:hypothetical protein
MTSNRPLEDWGKLLGDVPSATAILDRFLHHAEIITITGRSYRLKDRAGSDDGKKEKGRDDTTSSSGIRRIRPTSSAAREEPPGSPSSPGDYGLASTRRGSGRSR